MEAAKTSISKIFDRTKKLEIPYFQRSYVWDEGQWERFLDDMKYAAGCNYPYFMGSVILKQQEVSHNQDTKYTIIDGQQRLTTFILFFKVLYKKNHRENEFYDVFTTFRKEIILIHNYSDKQVFEKIFHDTELNDKDKESRLYKCYQYFLDNIEEGEIEPNDVLANISFVGIDLQHNEDEQQIFDTINSLGVRLTTAELLKNYFFSADDPESFNRNWKEIFEKDDETKEYWDQEVTAGRNIRSNIDLFLQSYLLIKIHEKSLNVTSEDKERFLKVESIFNSYKDFMKKYKLEKQKIILEIKVYADVYRNTINPGIVNEAVNGDSPLSRLNTVVFGLDTATIIPYLLFIEKSVTDEDEKNALYNYLEAYLMRRIITRKTTKNYNRIFRSFINNKVNTLAKLKEEIEKKGEMINGMPTDQEVTVGFNDSWLTNKQSKGVLFLIERSIRSHMNSTNLKSFNDYSLEHIMPKKWRNNWGPKNISEEDALKRDSMLLTLGNLTLITKQLNSSIRDASWRDKKIGNKVNKGLKEYAQGIEIFSRYLDLEEWSEKNIVDRARFLTSKAVNKVWKI